ncbi:MAG: proline iminopeptidase-family hydrolase [Steroidobacteraceae bacterium]
MRTGFYRALAGAALVCTLIFSAPPLQAAEAAGKTAPPSPDAYFDNAGRDDVFAGGVKLIPIDTPKGKFNVWTKRVGNNARIKVLLLHGGPAATHEYFEVFDSYFPGQGIEYYYYDQLGSYYSDQPEEPSLWDIPRFVEEVEQVRKALKLDRGNFYLFGQSWGGVLAMEYALKYQEHLAGLIVSNMMSDGKAYDDYGRKVLSAQIDPKVLAEIKQLEAAGDTENPRYMELLGPNFYTQHFLRMPLEQWPEPLNRSFKHLNRAIYVPMQGPSELGAGGKILEWDRHNDLAKIVVPTLMIGARYDTMDPKHMEWMSKQVRKGRYLYCPNGSHMAMYDDQKVYFEGLIRFIKDVDAGRIK